MADLFSKHQKTSGPVECLGKQFPNDQARRDHYVKLLAEKLADPKFRKIDGFPTGSDQDILHLSDPPYYTACPNPFIEDFIRYYGRPYDGSKTYIKEPFAADVSEGKNDPIYNAHSYHTKVPPRAIVRYILSYTEPGDVIFDGFCGTGMTAVAAQLCGDRSVVQALGYRVESDGTILAPEENQGKTSWKKFSKLGARRAVVNDLSPAATFISYSYNRFKSATEFEERINPILSSVEKEFSWMFQTLHKPTPGSLSKGLQILADEDRPDLSKAGPIGKINYIVWSDVFSCPECAGDIVFWDAAVDKDQGKVRDVFGCPHCDASLGKRNLEPKKFQALDRHSNTTVNQRIQVPAYINYSVGTKRFEKSADQVDRALANKIDRIPQAEWIPAYELKDGDKTGEPIRVGITQALVHY